MATQSSAVKPILFENATIISYDEESDKIKVLRNVSMLIKDGKVDQIVEGKLDANAEVIDAKDKIISPGFINTHHHMWQTQYRTIGANTTLGEYFARYGQTGPACKAFTPDDVYLGQIASALEMIDCGTTTVLDHAHATFTDKHVDAALDATIASGLRVFFAHTVAQLPTSTLDESLEKFKALLTDERFNDIVKLGLGYDSFAFVPPEISHKVMDTVIEHNNQSDRPVAVLTTHFVAGPYPANNSPQHLETMSVLSQPKLEKKLPVILSHASFMDEEGANLLRKHRHVTISTTPESESHYGHTSIGADECQDCASLGVDTHFTFSAYMPFQARLWLQHLRLKEYTKIVKAGNWPQKNPMSVEDAFLLMTKKGAEALGRNDLGLLKVGAQADVVVFDCSRPGLWACEDPVAAIILHSGGAGDVEGVMVNGKWLKKDGKILQDTRKIKEDFEESAKRIQAEWKKIA